MDNPHPRWECYNCQRQWQWTARPLRCGFCSCTYIMAVDERAKLLVEFERGVAALARTGPKKRAPRVYDRSKSITAGSKARLGW